MTASSPPPLQPAELLTQWSGAIRRWCLIDMGDPVRADDAAQDAAVRLLKQLHRYDRSRAFQPWLRQLVRNVCRDHHRSRRRQVAAPPICPVGARRDERDLDLSHAAHLADQAFATLTPRQREIVMAVDVEDKPPTQVALELELSAGAVRNQLFTARRKVRLAMLSIDPTVADLLEDL